MCTKPVRIDSLVRLPTSLPDDDVRRLAQEIGRLDGIETIRVADGRHALHVRFDPLCISGRDILKWLAQRSIRAELEQA